VRSGKLGEEGFARGRVEVERTLKSGLDRIPVGVRHDGYLLGPRAVAA